MLVIRDKVLGIGSKSTIYELIVIRVFGNQAKTEMWVNKGDIIYKVCGNGRSEGFGASVHSTHLTPRVVPCPHQSDGHRNLPTDPSVGLMQQMTLYVTSR